jgi:hypothetical protein
MLVVKDNRTENLQASEFPYSHRTCHEAVAMWLYFQMQNSGKEWHTAGYTLAGTALGVTGDGMYMEGSAMG